MTSPLRALLVDDEPPALERLQQLLRLCGDVEVVALVCSVQEAIGVLQQHPIDLVFLDERMPGGDGHTLLGQITHGVEVIFTTAHSDYAVDAFAAGVHDYLLKPVQAARLGLSLERLRDRRSCRAKSSPATSTGLWLEAGDGDRGVRQFVPFAEILWVAAMQNYTHLQLQEMPGLMVKRPLKHWEEQLPAGRFLRLDRSTIVQTSLISRCERQSRSCTLLRFGNTAEAPTLAVGSTAALRLQQAMALQP
ncbi:LytTR family DNA-binding domain-containing protein [Synechococcus sp. CBW1107]|uniref:LytR/AlgR family response regulator transcription factor n=1 Tax=Synechococcus sp. CBW1107 TaxID=2789857 RepID=UPI002AD482DC|nr:LytTR family DNA-binding domain-containing protein [Synechococcus sp. CBW1107]CAK6686665.1 Protein-glutamate methylesterase/protein-glutamine glutaminase [Synechococcus sp. CBW1107]